MTPGRQYVTVMDWMWDDLGLSGNDILCYALIYGFSQDGKSEFKGTASYVAQRLHIRKATALDILRRLTDRGVIRKREFTYQGKRYCFYSAETSSETGTETVPVTGTETVPVSVRKPYPIITRDNNNTPLTPQGEGTTISADLSALADLNPTLTEVVKAWIDYKTERRQAYKPTGLQALLTRVHNKAVAYGEEAVAEVIADSMANGYQGITWDRMRTPAQREEVADW